MVMTTVNAGTYLFILPWEIHHPGGVNQVVTNLYHTLSREGGYQPLLMVDDWHQPAPAFKMDGAFTTVVLRLRAPWDPNRPVRGLLSFLAAMPGSLRMLASLLREQRVSVVNPHYPTLSACLFALLKRLGMFRGRLVLSFHGLDIAEATRSRGMERLWWQWLLASADALVACSRSLADAVAAFAPACRDRIHVVHNGVDVRRLTQEAAEGNGQPAPLDGQPFVLSIGTFEHKKGQDILIRAFQEVRQDFPDVRLVLIGRSGEAESSLRQLIMALGLNDRVILVKDLPHDQVARYLRTATLFALPSRSEPFGIVVLEAGVFGLPVVACAVGGVPEIVVNGMTGRLVPPDDPSALAQAMLEVLRSPEKAAPMAQALRDHVTSQFSWERALERYLNIIAGKEAP